VLSVVLAYVLTRAGYEGTHAALALAISVSALLNAWLLYHGLRRDQVISHSAGWGRLLSQVLAGVVIMTACLIYMDRPLDWWIAASVMERLVWLATSIIAGMVVYFIVLLSLGLRPSNLRLRST
jgi:putative peptidoglycan lipid II flippase